MNTIVNLAAAAALAASTYAFNSNRKTEIEDWEKELSSENLNRWYIVVENRLNENNSAVHSSDSFDDVKSGGDPDPLSVVWYLGAFGGLIAFFLVVTFSEWCCASKHIYRRQAMARPYLSTHVAPETPPPPYHLFAPPPYEVVIEKRPAIYVIPVHGCSSSIELQPPPQV